MPRPNTPGSICAHLPTGVPVPASVGRHGATPYERFLLWERASRDTIEVKRTYIDMAGDLVAGIVLSQIVYWHLPDRDGNTRLRVERDGKLWLAKGRTEWWEECRVSPKQIDRALDTLRTRNVIETRIFKFNGSPTVHVRLNETGFMEQWENHTEGTPTGNRDQRPDFTFSAKSNFPEGRIPNPRMGETHLPGPGKTITKSTSEIPAKITTTAHIQASDGHQDDVVVALLHSLTNAGVTRKRAEALIANHDAKVIRDQLAMLKYRKADEPAAVLVRAIEEEWAPPAEYRKAEAERQQEERRRQKREMKAKEESDKAAVEEARRTAQDEYWGALDPDEKEKIGMQAEAALRTKSPFLFRNGGPTKTGVMYQTLLDTERRGILAELLAKRQEG